MVRLAEDTHVYPDATSVAIAIPIEHFWDEEGTLDYDRLDRAKAYAVAEAGPAFPNASITAFAYDSTSPHGTRIEGITLSDEIWAYEYLSWIETEADDIE